MGLVAPRLELVPGPIICIFLDSHCPAIFCKHGSRSQDLLSPLAVRNDSGAARAVFIDDLQRAALARIVCDEVLARRKVRRGPKIHLARIAPVAESMLADRPLIDG